MEFFQEIICLKKIKDGAYVIILDEYADVGTHWIALFYNRSEIVYFNSFGVEQVPEEIIDFIGNKNIIASIFRIQANDSVMCGSFALDSLILCLQLKPDWFYKFFSRHDWQKRQYNSELFQKWMKLTKQTDWSNKIQARWNK